MQWYHAVRRVEAYGRRLAAGEVAQLRAWVACQLRPPPVLGVLPSYVAAEALQPGCQPEDDEARGQSHAHADDWEAGDVGRQQQAAQEPAPTASMQRQGSSDTASSSMSFTH
jgi:hypothetical protein